MPETFACGIWNSGIFFRRIQNPRPLEFNDWNPKSITWNPESPVLTPESKTVSFCILFDWFNSTEFCSDWKLQRSGLERRTGLFQAFLTEIRPYLCG